MIANVLVPTDGSECSRRAARFASDLARASGARITLLHAYHPHGADVVGLSRRTREELQADLERLSEASFRACRAEIEGPVEVKTAVRVGPAAEEVLDYADREHVDLIVLGSRGLTPLQELLLGSVSDQVVRRASCPVTVVR